MTCLLTIPNIYGEAFTAPDPSPVLEGVVKDLRQETLLPQYKDQVTLWLPVNAVFSHKQRDSEVPPRQSIHKLSPDMKWTARCALASSLINVSGLTRRFSAIFYEKRRDVTAEWLN